jgi:integrase
MYERAASNTTSISILNELPKHSRLLLVLGYHTGMRLGELLGPGWQQVDLKANQIMLVARRNEESVRPRVPDIWRHESLA